VRRGRNLRVYRGNSAPGSNDLHGISPANLGERLAIRYQRGARQGGSSGVDWRQRPSPDHTDRGGWPKAARLRPPGMVRAAGPRDDVAVRAQSSVTAMYGLWRANPWLGAARAFQRAIAPAACSPYSLPVSQGELIPHS
jgi:hypothetical protein